MKTYVYVSSPVSEVFRLTFIRTKNGTKKKCSLNFWRRNYYFF